MTMAGSLPKHVASAASSTASAKLLAHPKGRAPAPSPSEQGSANGSPGPIHDARVPAPASGGRPTSEGASTKSAPSASHLLAFAELRVWAECFEDAQRARISCVNRCERGGIPAELFEAQLFTLLRAEHDIGLAMRRSYRRVVPADIIEWQTDTRGIGEHLLARFLGVVGHPVLATPYHWDGDGSDRTLIADPPFARTIAQLWSYCGVGDATRKKAKGMSADQAASLGNPRAKMLVRLLAEAAMKSRGPHREFYDIGRARYAERADWTDGHRHAAALRLTGKAILRDLWVAAS